MVALGKIFTPRELAEAKRLYESTSVTGDTFATQARDRIVAPALERINTVTGQENDPLYWAYALEFALWSRQV